LCFYQVEGRDIITLQPSILQISWFLLTKWPTR